MRSSDGAYTRKRPFRDAKLIVIAAEGSREEKEYFEGLQEFIDSTRLQIKFLRRPVGEEGNSAPHWVLSQLTEYRRENRPKAGDELWLVIDADRWDAHEVARVISEAKKSGIESGLSCPCFEVFLLCHFESLTADVKLGSTDSSTIAPATLKWRLGQHCDGLSRGFVERFGPRLEAAVTNGIALSPNPPPHFACLGTRVHLLLKNALSFR
jgi:hypothetical protein